MTGVPAWLSAIVLAAAMVASFALGRRLGRQRPDEGASRMIDAIATMLAVLLGFTFSFALLQHEQRRQHAVDDTNAIGDFYNCASLLDEPLRGQLQRLTRRYLAHRVRVARARLDGEALLRELRPVDEMQAAMRELVREAAERRSPVTIPLVDTLNALTSNHAARLAAVRYRLPWSIVAVLALAALLCALLLGMLQEPGAVQLVPPAVFVLLVSMVVWVTLDLNQPGGGAITVSREPMERLLATMPP
jgi:hypothetical protein